MRCCIVQLNLPGNGAVCDFSATTTVKNNGAVALDLVADAQPWCWPVVLTAHRGHDLEPVGLTLAQNIGGFFQSEAAGEPKGNVVSLCRLFHNKVSEGVAWCRLGQLVAQAFALVCELIIERGQRYGLGHFGDGDGGEFLVAWCRGTDLYQLGFVLRM